MSRTIELHGGQHRRTHTRARACVSRAVLGSTIACPSTFLLHYISSTFIFGATRKRRSFTTSGGF